MSREYKPVHIRGRMRTENKTPSAKIFPLGVHIRGRMRTEKIRELESKLTIEELQQMACMIDLLVEHHGWKMDELQAEIDRRVAEDNRRREEGTLVAVVRGIKQ